MNNDNTPLNVIDKTKDTPLGGFVLMKPPLKPGQCPECAVVHPADQPHDCCSPFYQYHFREQHGRWPKWKDALAHCTPEVQERWKEQLRRHGVKEEALA